ncbi:MAG: superoxide dismutase [Bacteroidales bacterium]|nr:superoxide dismutase [Bacteroidales bacterium]
MAFQLPELPYAYDALEPYIDKRTMELHHDKHHAGYTNKFNAAIEGTDFENMEVEEIFKNVSNHPVAVRNHGGGFYNHSLFWKMMSPNGGGEPEGDLRKTIERDFGSFENFRDEFSKAAAGRFGSGWAWLCLDEHDKLNICSTPNQDNPLMDVAGCSAKKLLLGLDVWEHAYYLKYHNRRADYIQAFWNIVNWDEVASRLKGK